MWLPQNPVLMWLPQNPLLMWYLIAVDDIITESEHSIDAAAAGVLIGSNPTAVLKPPKGQILKLKKGGEA